MPQPLLRNCFLKIETKGTPLPTGNLPAYGTQSDILWFTNMPENLGSSKQAIVDQTSILGRSETIKTYGSSNGRAWNVDLQFFAEDTSDSIRAEVVDKVNWCESLVHPIYSNGLSHGIPRILFKFGDYLSVMTICTNVQVNVPGPWSVTASGPPRPFPDVPQTPVAHETYGDISLPLYATVNLTLEDIGEKSWGHSDVKLGLHNGPR